MFVHVGNIVVFEISLCQHLFNVAYFDKFHELFHLLHYLIAVSHVSVLRSLGHLMMPTEAGVIPWNKILLRISSIPTSIGLGSRIEIL